VDKVELERFEQSRSCCSTRASTRCGSSGRRGGERPGDLAAVRRDRRRRRRQEGLPGLTTSGRAVRTATRSSTSTRGHHRDRTDRDGGDLKSIGALLVGRVGRVELSQRENEDSVVVNTHTPGAWSRCRSPELAAGALRRRSSSGPAGASAAGPAPLLRRSRGREDDHGITRPAATARTARTAVRARPACCRDGRAPSPLASLAATSIVSVPTRS